MSEGAKASIALSALVLFTILDIWIAFWFYNTYAKDTWMAWPTGITAVLLPFFGIFLTMFFIPDPSK